MAVPGPESVFEKGPTSPKPASRSFFSGLQRSREQKANTSLEPFFPGQNAAAAASLIVILLSRGNVPSGKAQAEDSWQDGVGADLPWVCLPTRPSCSPSWVHLVGGKCKDLVYPSPDSSEGGPSSRP